MSPDKDLVTFDKDLNDLVTFINDKLDEPGAPEPADLGLSPIKIKPAISKPVWFEVEIIDIAEDDRARRIARIRPPYRCICSRVFETAEQLFDHRC